MVVDGEVSGWKDVISSVLQGSVLGGTLFNIYVDDIDDLIKALIRKFADDCKIARMVKSEQDAQELQDDINRMKDWATKWEMQFNVRRGFHEDSVKCDTSNYSHLLIHLRLITVPL